MAEDALETYLKLADSKGLDVLFWLLHNRDRENIIHTTLDTVAGECAVTKVTVNRIFQKLYREGYLERIRNGQYRLKKI